MAACGSLFAPDFSLSLVTDDTCKRFYGSLAFVRDYPGELVPEGTFTHSHLSWSSRHYSYGLKVQ